MDQINNQVLGRIQVEEGMEPPGHVLAGRFPVLSQGTREHPIRKVAFEEGPEGGRICPEGGRSGWADSRGKGPGAGLRQVPRWALTYYRLIY